MVERLGAMVACSMNSQSPCVPVILMIRMDVLIHLAIFYKAFGSRHVCQRAADAIEYDTHERGM